jgi:hypothetical protein
VRFIVLAFAALALLVVPTTASAGTYHGPKVVVCYQNVTKYVKLSKVDWYLRKGATFGACPEPPVEEPQPTESTPAGDPDREGYCAPTPVFRVADASWGIYVDCFDGQGETLGYVPAKVGPHGETYC